MKSKNQSAYRLAPWRKQMQRIITILLAVFIIAAVTMIYLSISERMSAINLSIQALQEERATFSRKIADMTTDEGAYTSYKVLQSRAEEAGFVDIDFTDDEQYAYVIVDGYTGTGINTDPGFEDSRLPDVISLIKPEYTESLQEWLYKRITVGIESYEVTN
ncbi:MAG: hypothetical protein IKP86_13130 [Anaerolineaceae bacterium]|nr:hypothetical protein [Anaerolineaceae bacterium]